MFPVVPIRALVVLLFVAAASSAAAQPGQCLLCLAQLGADDFQNAQTIQSQISSDANKFPRRSAQILEDVEYAAALAQALLRSLPPPCPPDEGPGACAPDALRIELTRIVDIADRFFVAETVPPRCNPYPVQRQLAQEERLLDAALRALQRVQELLEDAQPTVDPSSS